MVEQSFLYVDDGTLDTFVRLYCEAHDIECDGDRFGQAFSGIESIYYRDAERVILEQADIFDLRLKK